MTKSRYLMKILRDSTGSSSVEYGFILAMIVLAIFLAMQGVATETVNMWQSVSSKSANAINGQ